MSCPEIRTRLLFAEMEEFAPEGDIGRHLAGCPGCADQVVRIQVGTTAAAETLNRWSSNLEPDQIVDRIAQAQASARSRSEHWWGIMGTAAIVLVSLLVYVTKAERAAWFRAEMGFPDLPYITSIEVRCIPPEAAVEVALAILADSRGTAKTYENTRSVVLSGSRPRVAEAEIAIRMADGTLDSKHPRACSTPQPDIP